MSLLMLLLMSLLMSLLRSRVNVVQNAFVGSFDDLVFKRKLVEQGVDKHPSGPDAHHEGLSLVLVLVAATLDALRCNVARRAARRVAALVGGQQLCGQAKVADFEPYAARD